MGIEGGGEGGMEGSREGGNGQMDKEKYSTSWKHLLSRRLSSVFTKSPGPLIDGDGDANKQKFGAGRGWPASSVIGFVMCVSDPDIL